MTDTPTSGRFACPGCGTAARVGDTRVHQNYRLRRYDCPACGMRFSSVEVALPPSAAISGHAGTLSVLADYLICHARAATLLRELGRRFTENPRWAEGRATTDSQHAGKDAP